MATFVASARAVAGATAEKVVHKLACEKGNLTMVSTIVTVTLSPSENGL